MAGLTTTCNACRSALFLWAVVLAVSTLPLVAVGGLVTSTSSGMADPDWHFTPFKLLTAAGWAEMGSNVALMIEHSHRQIGYLVGMLAIGLAVGCLCCQAGSKRWLGLIVLLAVSAQGALGAFRIKLHAWFGPEFALIHGITGQLVFVLIVAAALWLSSGWARRETIEEVRASKVRRLALLAFIMAVVQLVSGATLRHLGGDLLLAVHLIFAVAVAVHVMLVWGFTLNQASGLLRWPAALALMVLGLQVLLGFGAWWAGGGYPAQEARDLTQARIALTTSHQTLGAVLLATLAVVWLRSRHHLPTAAGQSANSTQIAGVSP